METLINKLIRTEQTGTLPKVKLGEYIYNMQNKTNKYNKNPQNTISK